MFCLYDQLYMISGSGEPNLSFHSCRFIVYISTLAKPVGIYLTFLFSIERLFTKILSKFILSLNKSRQLFQRLYTLFIFLGIILIISIRLYETLKLIPKSQSIIKPALYDESDTKLDITDTANNSSDRNVTFKYCFYSMNIDIYARILSFYVIQYSYEYALLAIIISILLIILIQQFRLILTQQKRFSTNTKLYLSLSLCVIISELILLRFHFIVDDVDNNNTNTQLGSLRVMLFAFSFRCIFLPLIVCITTCQPLKQFLYELFILRPYLDNINENDIENQPEPFSSSQGTHNRFGRTFNKNNNHEHFDDDELQADL
jgi:hypothetical protein